MAVKNSLPAPIVVCGPSGVGKGVLIKKLQEVFENKFGFSVSHTTRGPRPGEEQGIHYHFTDFDTMRKEIDEDKFIEYATVHGNMYGTSKAAVEAVRTSGRVCILDIDVQGAQKIFEKRIWEGIKFIFIMPPSMEELERRLRGRGTETEEKVQTRLGNARGEVEFAQKADFFNHTFVLDGLTGDNVPLEVLELIALLKDWFPSLGGMPAEESVLLQFRKADRDQSGLIHRYQLLQVLRNLGPVFTDEQLGDVIEGSGCKNGDIVDYQKFLAGLFREG